MLILSTGLSSAVKVLKVQEISSTSQINLAELWAKTLIVKTLMVKCLLI